MTNRRAKELNRLSADQSVAALRLLVDQGKLKAADVLNALKHRERLIREVRERLAALGVDGIHLISEAKKAGRTIGRSLRQSRADGRKVRRRLSAATRAKRRLQGSYMGLVRNLTRTAKEQVRSIRKKSGYRAAIAAAKKMAK